MGWACTRGQLALIAINVLTYFVAFANLLMAVSSWPYMRDIYHGIPYIGCALGGIGMFLPVIGFWGTLVKKNLLIKFYFYSALTAATAMLTYATYCLIYRGEVGDYIDEHFLKVLNHMPTKDPQVCECGNSCTSTGDIQSCKDAMSSRVRGMLLGLALTNILTAAFISVGVVLSMKLLKWARLTTPVLEGGAISTIAVSFLVIFFGLYAPSGGGWDGASTLRHDMWGLYLSAGTAFILVVACVLGVVGSRLRRVGILKVVQILQIVCLCMLLASAIVCLIQGSALDDECKDHFESELRRKQSAGFCDKEDFASTTNCNSDVSAYYTCSGSPSKCYPIATYESYCLSTNECCSKLLGQSPKPSLWANGVFCIYMMAFVIVGFLAAKSKIREVKAEENMMKSSTTRNEVVEKSVGVMSTDTSKEDEGAGGTAADGKKKSRKRGNATRS